MLSEVSLSPSSCTPQFGCCPLLSASYLNCATITQCKLMLVHRSVPVVLKGILQRDAACKARGLMKASLSNMILKTCPGPVISFEQRCHHLNSYLLKKQNMSVQNNVVNYHLCLHSYGYYISKLNNVIKQVVIYINLYWELAATV